MSISMKAARVNANLTQREVAEKMEVSRKTVINWENGNTDMSIADFHMYCKICNANVDEVDRQKR